MRPIAVLRRLRYAPVIEGLPPKSERVLDLYIPTDRVPASVVRRIAARDPSTLTTWPIAVATPPAEQDAAVAEPGAGAGAAESPRAPPLIALTHGGSWFVGDNSQRNMREASKCFARMGYVVASVNYRLCTVDYRQLETLLLGVAVVSVMGFMCSSSAVHRVIWLLLALFFTVHLLMAEIVGAAHQVQHPMPARDVAAAVGWLHTHAPRVGADTTRMVLVGHSAGGHLVLHVATHGTLLAEAGVPLEHVAGVVGISGVYSAKLCAEWSALRLICSSVFGADSRLWRYYFPAENAFAHPRPSALPPVLLETAHYDFSLLKHAVEMRRTLRRLGVPVRLENVRGATHFSIVTHWTAHHHPVLLRLCAFIEDVVARPMRESYFPTCGRAR